MRVLCTAITLLASFLVPQAAYPATLPGIPEFIDKMVAEHRFKRGELESVFVHAQHRPAVIEAISRLQVEALLMIAGEGDKAYSGQLKYHVERLGIQKRAFFLGHVTGPKKENLLSSADILVMPSHTENFGNVVLEALSFGLPVIASKGSPWNLLETYQCGYWVENDPATLAATIDTFLRLPPNTIATMKQNGRKCVSENFLFRGQENRYRQLYGITIG